MQASAGARLLTHVPLPLHPSPHPRRRLAQRLAAALQARDEQTACQLLTEAGAGAGARAEAEAGAGAGGPGGSTPTRLGWVRDPDSGGYPAHIAAWHGLGGFLLQLVEANGEGEGAAVCVGVGWIGCTTLGRQQQMLLLVCYAA